MSIKAISLRSGQPYCSLTNEADEIESSHSTVVFPSVVPMLTFMIEVAFNFIKSAFQNLCPNYISGCMILSASITRIKVSNGLVQDCDNDIITSMRPSDAYMRQ